MKKQENGLHFGSWFVVMAGVWSTLAFALDPLPTRIPHPAANPTTAAKVRLGRMLYFDARLSRDGTVSCNSCHDVIGQSGGDGMATSTGIGGQKGGRNAPTVWNAAYYSVQFWDGRAASLEEQAKGPITNPIEMGMPDHAAAVAAIQAIPGYRTYFDAAFGKGKAITIDQIAQAIATYERTLITPRSAVDRYLKGDQKALNAAAKRGMQLVQTVGCVSCHMGPNYAGPALPEGIGFYQKFPVYSGSPYDSQYKLLEDSGRFMVTQKEEDRHRYRVPTWRNIARTAPYFHNGSVATLDEAVRVMAKTQLNRELKPEELSDIVAFLTALNGELPQEKAPQLPQ